jgi:hypothetical protein
LGQQSPAFCQREAKSGKTAVGPLKHGQRHRIIHRVANVGAVSESSLNDQAHGFASDHSIRRQRSPYEALSRVNRSQQAALEASHTFAHSLLGTSFLHRVSQLQELPQEPEPGRRWWQFWRTRSSSFVSTASAPTSGAAPTKRP